VVYDHPTFGLGEVAIQVRETRPTASGSVERRKLGVGGITEQAEHALFAVMGHPLDVEVFANSTGV